MNNPFESLGSKVKPQDAEYDEWSGQFSCMTAGCNGYSKIAKYIRSLRVLTWQCENGHISRIEDIDE